MAQQIRTFTICYQIRLRFDLKFCTILRQNLAGYRRPSASQFVADLSIGHRQLAQFVVGQLMLKSDSNSPTFSRIQIAEFSTRTRPSFTQIFENLLFLHFLLQNLLTGRLLHTKLHQHSTQICQSHTLLTKFCHSVVNPHTIVRDYY